MEYDTMLYQARQPRQAVDDARAWLIDSSDQHHHPEIRLASTIRIVAMTDDIYVGGWTQFLKDNLNLKEGSR